MTRFRNRLIKYLVIVLSASAHPVFLALTPPQSKKMPPAVPAPSSTPAQPAAEEMVMTAPSLTKPRPEYQFPVGQTYVYGAEWRIFNAGIATLRMEKVGQENRVVGTANA